MSENNAEIIYIAMSKLSKVKPKINRDPDRSSNTGKSNRKIPAKKIEAPEIINIFLVSQYRCGVTRNLL